ncbi:hypothetical protein HDV04_005930 [Boothiomyces sp. JEL0838]|nr:hypothetical protein HDV04_005930 [Boothiomyces sp. JEL0838]
MEDLDKIYNILKQRNPKLKIKKTVKDIIATDPSFQKYFANEKYVSVQRDDNGNFLYSNQPSESKLLVIPTPEISTPPKLGKIKPKIVKKQDPVVFKDYGLFCSFAPQIDSGFSCFSGQESSLTGVRVQFVFDNDDFSGEIFDGSKKSAKAVDLDLDFDLDELKEKDDDINVELDLDLEKIQKLPEILQESRENPSQEFLDLLLKENTELIKELKEMQTKRFKKRMFKPSEKEQKLADKLVDNLKVLGLKSLPKDLVNFDLEKTINLVDLYEPCYKGTLRK